ncbi:hypothetical protein BJ165DRAFT_1493653 [Panaeolus papilionaceus]|nr:hypothetical protein BJ165DRAFT_1493653 [Panaeolus papilionaceus]
MGGAEGLHCRIGVWYGMYVVIGRIVALTKFWTRVSVSVGAMLIELHWYVKRKGLRVIYDRAGGLTAINPNFTP